MRNIIGIMLVLAFVVPASAVIYVDPAGSDANPGTSGSPKLTIQNAVWAANAAMDPVVQVAPGTYAGFYNESAPAGGGTPGVGNNPGAPALSVTVRSGATGTDWANTIINSPSPFAGPAYYPRAGTGADNPYADVYGGGAEHDSMPFVSQRSVSGSGAATSLSLRGFTVRGDALDVSLYAGNTDAGGGTHVTGLEGVCGVGVTGRSDNIAHDVLVYNSVITGFSAGKFPGLEGESVGWEGFETGAVPGNPQPYMWANMNAGLMTGQYGEISIENSLIAGNLQGGYLNTASNHKLIQTVVNCTITDNQLSGLANIPYDPGVYVDNSIVWGNGTMANFPTVGLYGDAGGPPIGADFSQYMWTGNSFIVNNTIFETSGDLIGWGGGAPLTPGVDVQGVATANGGTGNLLVNPLFAGGTYQLTAGSPAVDAGGATATAEASDLWGGARVLGAGIDMGADEVPEPATMVILGIGAVGVMLRRRRRA